MAGARIGALTLAIAGAIAVAAPASASAGDSHTVWLCKPGQDPNPCRGSLETTVFESDGSSRVENPPNARRPRVDCFYVYPTVSDQPTVNADLTVDPEQTAIARYQASRFSRRCRVYAPLYRQLTLDAVFAANEEETIAAGQLAYSDVRAAWRDYLRDHNRGRGVVLIGHSQGSYMLRKLIAEAVEPRRKVRELLVSALLPGGNVTVEQGRRRGGDFERIPACKTAKQTGCVVGYSIFNETPPADARFGITSTALGDAFGLPSGDDLEILCNNPAALGGGAAPLETLVPTEPFPGTLGLGILIMYGGELPSASTPWVSPPEHYAGECVREGAAHVLLASSLDGARVMTPSPDPTWGLHLGDVNLALGDLVGLVGSQSRAFLAQRRAGR
jgi:hypothetical protein